MSAKNRGEYPTIRAVRDFWDQHPLCGHLIDSAPGSEAFLQKFDQMRSLLEPDEFVEQMLAPSKSWGLRVLDVGCGNGYMLAKFAQNHAQAIGVELSMRAVGITRKRMQRSNLQAAIVQADARDLPFDSSTFDLVYSLGVLHHSPNIHRSLREIYRVLRRAGTVVIMLYNKNSVFYRLRIPAMKYLNPSFRGRSIQDICNHLDGPRNPLGRFYSRSEVQSMMDGFTTPHFQPFFFSHLHFPGKPDIFPPALCKFLGRHFGWFLYVKAQKA